VLCVGRDQDQLTYLAVRAALITAVAAGRCPAPGWRSAAARVADLRSWIIQHSQPPGGASPAASSGEVGLAAARRAVRADGIAGPVRHPLVVDIVPPTNIAVRSVPWGWAPGSRHKASGGLPLPGHQAAVAARPDAIVVEIGLPVS
jgi:beta-N-acetylhexosaminidase